MDKRSERFRPSIVSKSDTTESITWRTGDDGLEHPSVDLTQEFESDVKFGQVLGLVSENVQFSDLPALCSQE